MCASVSRRVTLSGLEVLALLLGWTAARARPSQEEASHSALLTQPQEEADQKSAGCVTCHTAPD